MEILPVNTTPAIILPANFRPSFKMKLKPCKEKEGLECLVIAAKKLKHIVEIKYAPKSKLWTIKVGFIWERDTDFVRAAQSVMKKILPLMDIKTEGNEG